MENKNLRKENEIYETPKCEIIEIQNEGVLCGSGELNASHGAMSTGKEYNFIVDQTVWN